MFKTTRGLILREVKYKDGDKILTVLTETDGKLTVSARGVYKKNSKLTAATQLFTFSELTLFCNKERWSLNEAFIIEPFLGLRNDILALSVASYVAELLEAVADADDPNTAILHLGLNALFALSHNLYPPMHIKACFELRLMCLAGYMPSLEHCAVCGTPEMTEARFHTTEGNLTCSHCVPAGRGGTVSLCQHGRKAMQFVLKAPSKKIFSFSLPPESEEKFQNACEAFVLTQLERSFRTLHYINML